MGGAVNLKILSHGVADGSDLEKFRRQPAFRKATRAMMLGCAAIEAALGENPRLRSLLAARPERFGLVMGSAFGELETTKDFLTTLADTGLARPLLFQNSLHNSMTGFASIHFSFTGPVLTTSHGVFVAEHALELASLLLDREHCDFCVVAIVDTFIPELGPTPQEAPTVSQKRETASALVLSRAGLFEEFGLRARAAIRDVACHRQIASSKLSYGALFLSGENTLDKLQTAMERPEPGAGSLRIEKPGHCHSILSWSRE